MTKIDIFSGFLGAGKTTLIKKMIEEAYKGEKLVLIENEFGEIGIDGGFLAEAGIQINEMNSGCICCSLVGDFGKALTQVLEQYAPDRILIEPSGVGKLSDVIRAVQNLEIEGAELNAFTTVVDAGKCKMYMKNFGEFFNDQVANAGCIVLSHTGTASEKKIADCVAMLREHNETATIVTTDWDVLSAEQLLEAMERKDTLEAELARLAHAHHEHEHHHHHDHDEHCECGCHDHDHEHEHEHHHDHDEHCECGCHDHEHEHHHHHDHEHEHHHHHDHEEGCSCGCGGHGHHHHHHADEVFVSAGAETTAKFNAQKLAEQLEELCDEGKYGIVLRAKGIVAGDDGSWIHFDYVPGEPDIRTGAAGIIGRLCVIGSGLDIEAIGNLLGVELKRSEG
ncbi:MAG: GTP-binding protein [Clostridia bacterium]|nr:GTP-binding protein [Clostridia bacterium]